MCAWVSGLLCMRRCVRWCACVCSSSSRSKVRVCVCVGGCVGVRACVRAFGVPEQGACVSVCACMCVCVVRDVCVRAWTCLPSARSPISATLLSDRAYVLRVCVSECVCVCVLVSVLVFPASVRPIRLTHVVLRGKAWASRDTVLSHVKHVDLYVNPIIAHAHMFPCRRHGAAPQLLGLLT